MWPAVESRAEVCLFLSVPPHSPPGNGLPPQDHRQESPLTKSPWSIRMEFLSKALGSLGLRAGKQSPRSPLWVGPRAALDPWFSLPLACPGHLCSCCSKSYSLGNLIASE